MLLGDRDRYETGTERIAILEWHPDTATYRVMSRAYFMRIRAGRAMWPSGNKSVPIGDLMTTLRAMSRRQCEPQLGPEARVAKNSPARCVA